MSFCRKRSLVRPPLLAGLAGLFGAAVMAAAGPSRPSKQYSIEQFLASTKVTGVSFSADESKILFSSNESGIFNVWTVPVRGGPASPLTRSASDTTYAVSYFPKDDRFLYTRDEGGNELNHLYVMDREGKERDLTPGEKLKATFAGWNRAGDAFYVLTNERDPRFFDLYRYDAKTYERRRIYEDTTGYWLSQISDDGRWLALQKLNTTSDSDIYLWNVETREMRLISKHEGTADFEPATFDVESKWLYFLTNQGSEFVRVRRYELATGRSEDVEKADWDVVWTFFSQNGKYRVSGTNEDGRTVLRVWHEKTDAPVALPAFPPGEIGFVHVSRSETKLAFVLDSDRSPNNLYVFELGGAAPRRLTDTLSKSIDPEDLVAGRVVRFRSFDGMEVPNIFYKPHQATPVAKAPALVWVHGGPGGQTRRQYNPSIQYLVNHGYVVLGINNRGSSGYGKSFYTADDGKHGREPLWDCVAAKKYLQGLPEVDANRIGILGGSYGGYMVLAALAFQPEQFAVGVDIFGISNWPRTLESMPKWWEAQRAALYKEIGDPEKDAPFLRETSPIFHADKIRRPLIVIQGANDPRVIKPESDDIVAAVRKNLVPVEYIVFDDEGHGFTIRKNEIAAWGAIRKFLDEHLKGDPGAAK